MIERLLREASDALRAHESRSEEGAASRRPEDIDALRRALEALAGEVGRRSEGGAVEREGGPQWDGGVVCAAEATSGGLLGVGAPVRLATCRSRVLRSGAARYAAHREMKLQLVRDLIVLHRHRQMHSKLSRPTRHQPSSASRYQQREADLK